MVVSEHNNYPIIKIPSFIEKAKKAEPTFLEHPPSKPSKSYEPNAPSKNYSNGYHFLIILGGIMLCFLVNNSNLVPVIFILAVMCMTNVDGNDDAAYNKKLNQYRERLSEFKKEESDYPKRLKNYEDELILFCERKNKVFSQLSINNHRKDEYYKSLKNTEKPTRQYDRGLDKVGLSENKLYNALKLKFPNQIFRDITIQDCSYKPDIVYWDSNNNICFDIEVDEPYVMETGEPIHYTDDKKSTNNNSKGRREDSIHHVSFRSSSIHESSTGKDTTRDYFFLNNGWFVIRFAEIQVVNDTKNCVDLVEKLSWAVRNQDYENILSPIHNIREVEQWTKDDSYKMAYQRFREKYINN